MIRYELVCELLDLGIAGMLLGELARLSSMSPIAASVTKSWVEGLTPRTELAPLLSPMPCACAEAANNRQIPTKAYLHIWDSP